MAEKLCELRKKGGGGGKYTETSLWTNPSPTSAFAAQAVTLSDSMDNYKYLRVRYRMSTTDANEYSCIFLVNDIKHSSASTNVPQFSVVARTNTTYVRTFYYVSGTSLQMNTAYVMNNTGNVTNVAIPLEILGLNELAQGEKPVIPTFSIQIAAANNRSAAAMNLDVANYNTLTIGSVTKGSGVTVRNAQIRDVNNTVLYTINVSSSEQTFDVSTQTRIVIVLDATGTTAWQELRADNFYLS